MKEPAEKSDEFADKIARRNAQDFRCPAVSAVSEPVMSSTAVPHEAADGSAPRDAVASTPARKTLSLSVRAGAFDRGRSDPSKAAAFAPLCAHAASSAHNGAIPLKRLTAGRKEMKINHDGATYLLRVTKSNKLILTKEAATVLAAVTS